VKMESTFEELRSLITSGSEGKPRDSGKLHNAGVPSTETLPVAASAHLRSRHSWIDWRSLRYELADEFMHLSRRGYLGLISNTQTNTYFGEQTIPTPKEFDLILLWRHTYYHNKHNCTMLQPETTMSSDQI
jgi:hypothetical protein